MNKTKIILALLASIAFLATVNQYLIARNHRIERDFWLNRYDVCEDILFDHNLILNQQEV